MLHHTITFDPQNKTENLRNFPAILTELMRGDARLKCFLTLNPVLFQVHWYSYKQKGRQKLSEGLKSNAT